MIGTVTPEIAWSTAKSELPARLDALRSRSYFDLLALPAYQNEDVQHGEHSLRWTIYRDVLDDRSLIIVVQLGMAAGKLLRTFEVRNVVADGFHVNQNEATRPMSQEELYEFM